MRLLLVALALAATVACGNGTGPDEHGTYRLTSLNGASLPYDDDPGCCIYTGGSLVLDRAGYRATIAFRNKNNGLTDEAEERGRYSRDGSAITFVPTAANLPLFLHGGTITGDVIRVSLGGDGPGAADQFRAVFER